MCVLSDTITTHITWPVCKDICIPLGTYISAKSTSSLRNEPSDLYILPLLRGLGGSILAGRTGGGEFLLTARERYQVMMLQLPLLRMPGYHSLQTHVVHGGFSLVLRETSAMLTEGVLKCAEISCSTLIRGIRR